MMDKAETRELVAIMSLRQGSQPAAYYEILALVIAPAAEMQEPEATQEPADTARGRRGRSVTEQRSWGKGSVAQTGTKPQKAVNAEDIEFRRRCLMLLGKGPDDVVARVLTDETIGLLNDRYLGPQVALMLKTRSPAFDAAAYLKAHSDKYREPAELCEVVTVAQKLGSGEMVPILGALFLTDKAAVTDSSAQATEADAPACDPVRSAARALGTLGRSVELQQAFNTTNADGARSFIFPVEVRKAALEGMAYLPPEAGPVPTLRRFSSLLLEPEMKKAGEEALLDAFRLQVQGGGG
jgi:hypothetical protein